MMSLEFYAECNKCHDCGRSDRIFIGKHSCGWTFLFNGYCLATNTAKKWFKFLNSLDVTIVDDMNRKYEFEEFYDMVMRWQNDETNLHKDYDLSSCEWLDEDGFRFLDYHDM
jgi:hypothetical protein